MLLGGWAAGNAIQLASAGRMVWDHDQVDTRDWVAAGLYRPDAPDAPERKALLEYLWERGATLEEMQEADRLGGLPGVAGALALGVRVPTLPLEEIAIRCGVPEAQVRRILLAAGLPVDPTDKLPADLQTVIAGFQRGAELIGEDALLAFTRVLGAAATNIAEAAIALFHSEFGPGSEREGSGELAQARLSEQATLAFRVVPDVLSLVVLHQFQRAARRAARMEGWSSPPDAAAEAAERSAVVIALGFVDLVGSTAWAEYLSLREQSLALSRFESAAWSSAVLAGGRVVKMIGDEVFFAAPSVDTACEIGLEVCRAAGIDPVLPPARGAIGYGSVTPREGDYFGPLVNLVARLVKVAEPGTLILTQEAAESLATDRWTIRPLGVRPIQGLDQHRSIFSLGADLVEPG
jgi:adenylate cyclase